MMLSVTPRTTSPFDNYDPFAASSSTSSFLPSRGLFSPISPPRTQQPVYCTTIPEEDDSEDDARPAKASSSSSTPHRTDRQASSITINPRMLRADSCTSDDDSDIPAVLKFPFPPASLPSVQPLKLTAVSTRTRPAAKVIPNRPAQITIPPPQPHPQSTLRSCFEDDSPSPSDVGFTLPSMTTIISRTSSYRNSAVIGASPGPKSAIMSPVRPASAAPVSLLRRATNALKSPRPTPPATLSPATVKLPESPPVAEKKAPSSPPRKLQSQHHPRVTKLVTPVERHHEPLSVSPTPSLTSSASSYSDSKSSGRSSWIGMGYVPVGTIMEADTTPVKDLDDYLETFESYFPSTVWDPLPANHDTPVGKRDGGAPALKRAHSVRGHGHSRSRSGSRSGDSGILAGCNATSPPSEATATRKTHSRSRNQSVDSAFSTHSRSRTSSGGSLNRMSVVVGESNGPAVVLGHPKLSRASSVMGLSNTAGSSQSSSAPIDAGLKRTTSSSRSSPPTSSTMGQYKRPAMTTSATTTTAATVSPPLTPPTSASSFKAPPKSILKPSRSSPNLPRKTSSSSMRIPPPVPAIPAMFSPPSTPASSYGSSSSRYKTPIGSPSPLSPSSISSSSFVSMGSIDHSIESDRSSVSRPTRSAVPRELLIRQRAATGESW
ncbi:hypothetical protein FRB94_004579 [Tulasnella sp. JGI-2019a]|nr:hypothetical protein FRB94_004579 [Tulasnella sp. JGI-2019a]